MVKVGNDNGEAISTIGWKSMQQLVARLARLRLVLYEEKLLQLIE